MASDSLVNHALIRAFWAAMATNEFANVTPLVTADFTCDWPQSRERIEGAANFVQMNHEYPARDLWRFTIERIVTDAEGGVSDVIVTDGHVVARAISFFTVRGGRIARIVEYWPEPYPAPANRARLVTVMP